MKRIALATAFVLTLSAAPAVAQTRVNVWFGAGVPGPYASGIIVIHPRYPYYRPYYREHEYYRDDDRFFYDAPRGLRRGYWRHRHPWHRHYDEDRD